VPHKPTISIIGPGNLAGVLASALRAAGYVIEEVVARDLPASRRRARELARRVGARPAVLGRARLESRIVWICVSDDAIAPTARALAQATDWRSKIALHSSGALGSEELAPLRRRGAAIASLHPMMTFVPNSRPSLAGVAFAVEGDAAAVRVARRIACDLKGDVFTIRPQAKALYHAVGSFSSPMVVATLATAERVARAAGIPRAQTEKMIRPILRRTLENYLRHGTAAAFSGPIARADANTIRKHLEALKKVPGALAIYLALARSALRNLPVRDRKAVEKVLQGEARD